MSKTKLEKLKEEIATLEAKKELPDFPDSKTIKGAGREFKAMPEVFYGKNSLRVFIINRQNKLDCAVVNVKDGFFTRKGKKYMVESEHVKYWKYKPYSFYSEANPKPLNYNFTHSQVDSKTLQTLLDTKFVQDMVKNPKETMIVMVLAGVSAIASLIVAGRIFEFI